MKVLICANNDIGLYRFRKELIQELLRNNEVYISLPYGELVEPLKAMGCIFEDTYIDRRGIDPVEDIKLFAKYMRLFRRVRPDIVITYTIKPNVYGGVAAKIMRIRYFMNITGLGTAFEKQGSLRKIVVSMYHMAASGAKKIFFENSANMAVFLNENICLKEQACLLNGAGVNLQEYPLKAYPSPDKTVFLFVGRVMKEKGVDEFLYAAQKIHSENENAEFLIAGFMEDDYEDVIKAAENEDYIKYIGHQNNMNKWYKAASCIVLPSYHEGMSNVLLEAAASGRPVITSDIPGCREAVDDGVTGYLCKVKDKEDVYLKMKAFADLPHDSKAAMGLAGNKRISEIFDKRDVVKKTIAAIKA